METKQKLIKLQLAESMREFNLKQARDTGNNFNKLIVKKKNIVDHAITSLHTYNLLDHPDYINSKKIQKRIVLYNQKKNKQKVASLSHVVPLNHEDLELSEIKDKDL